MPISITFPGGRSLSTDSSENPAGTENLSSWSPVRAGSLRSGNQTVSPSFRKSIAPSTPMVRDLASIEGISRE